MKKLIHVLSVLGMTIFLGCTPQKERMVFPRDLELVNLPSEFDSICFHCTNQVAVYCNFEELSFYPFREIYLWSEIKDQFPEVGFIFYFSGKDKDRLKTELANLNFPFAVYHDPDFEFYKMNRLDTVRAKYDVLFAYHVKNGFVIKPAQIGFQEAFIEELESVLKD